jgi:hypothetical protein
MKKLLTLIIIVLTFSSCKIVHSLIELNKKTAKVYSYKVDDKDVRFLPMHHLGKRAFYDNVKKIVTENKANGFVVYYELVSTDFTKDSLLRDTIRRKVRKIKGFGGTYKENMGENHFKKHIQQPSYPDLGTDTKDLRADVNYLQLINEWERVNGAIVLDSMDLHTPFTEKFSKDVFYTKSQYNKIFIEYRNEYLINLIRTSPENKILVLYGAGHRKDFKKRIRKYKKG